MQGDKIRERIEESVIVKKWNEMLYSCTNRRTCSHQPKSEGKTLKIFKTKWATVSENEIRVAKLDS